MAFSNADTTAYPTFSGATAKRDMLREILEIGINVPGLEDLVYRINNTDLTGTTDGATVYLPTDTFASA